MNRGRIECTDLGPAPRHRRHRRRRLLHIRTFDDACVRIDTYEELKGGVLCLVSADASGRVLSDTPEAKPVAEAQAIADLKQRLPGWLPPHVLSDAERGQAGRQPQWV